MSWQNATTIAIQLGAALLNIIYAQILESRSTTDTHTHTGTGMYILKLRWVVHLQEAMTCMCTDCITPIIWVVILCKCNWTTCWEYAP
jgi:hypothetical protein